tara:strand:- start:532 stop:1833 length:1302 start_codon:yes stop_codon:yes gene_type:complete
MDFYVEPSENLSGEIEIPGDKSISHRAVIFGALACGVSEFENFLSGEDCLATLDAFENLGVKVNLNDGKLIINGVGINGLNKASEALYLGNSGTSARLLIGLLGAQKFESTIKGDMSLSGRPMNRVLDPLEKMGANIQSKNGRLPIHIKSVNEISSIKYSLPIASAQVKSSLILASIYADSQSKIKEKWVTRDHTERMMQSMGYPISVTDNIITVEGNGKLNPIKLNIPGDFSSSVFLIVACLITPNSSITIKNVGTNSTRTGFLRIAKMMGANIDIHNKRMEGYESVADINVRTSSLQSIQVEDNDLVSLSIDEFPAIFILAANADGTSIFRGLKELRVKESDRISSMAKGFQRLGINTVEFEDGIQIEGGKLDGGDIECFGDHRVAMSFAVAGASAKNAIRVNNVESVGTSFPSFLDCVKEIGICINTNKD